MTRTTARTAALLATAGLSALLLTGCGSSGHAGSGSHATPTAGPAASGPHNEADVAFATGMLPHHAQAVEMAEMALGRDTAPEVQRLATAIKAAQAPEMATMSGWLTGWGRPVPTSSAHDAHSMSTDDGMMSADDMTALDEAEGSDFARLWVTGMIRHHEGAVTMARAELKDGASSQAKALAGSIIAGQSAEIATMKALLATLG